MIERRRSRPRAVQLETETNKVECSGRATRTLIALLSSTQSLFFEDILSDY
jgi:hypothetical protein